MYLKIIGISIIGLGLYVVASSSAYSDFQKVVKNSLPIPVWLILCILGSIIVLAAIFGSLGALCESKCTIYFVSIKNLKQNFFIETNN